MFQKSSMVIYSYLEKRSVRGKKGEKEKRKIMNEFLNIVEVPSLELVIVGAIARCATASAILNQVKVLVFSARWPTRPTI